MKAGWWSRPRGPVLLAIAACAACCAPPLVALLLGAGAGAGAGAASAIAAIAEPLAGILLASAAVLGIVLYARRRRTCAIDGGCGCGPGGMDSRRDSGTLMR